MKTRIQKWLAGAVCLMAVAAAAPAAHAAEWEMQAAFRAGQILEAELKAGDEQTARQVVNLFVNSIHGYFENSAGDPAWVVWTPDLKQIIVATTQVAQIGGGNGIVFVGYPTEGPLVGSKITGAIFLGQDKKLRVMTQVLNQSLNVLFTQPLEQLNLQEGSGTGS